MGKVAHLNQLFSLAVAPNVTDSSGGTPAHYAAALGYTHVLRILRDAGADLNAMDINGNMPADLARASGHEDVIKNFKDLGMICREAVVNRGPGFFPPRAVSSSSLSSLSAAQPGGTMS